MKNIKIEIVFLIVTAFAGLVGFTANTSSAKGISFYPSPYPITHGLISPNDAGLFSVAGNPSDFVLTVTNNGSLGTDTYDLTAASPWTMALYAADGITPLADTDTDGTMDTGPISQGSSLTIIARVATPGGATLGDSNSATITACSSLNLSECKTSTLQSAIPAVSFAQTYVNYAEGAMTLEFIQPNAQVAKKVSADWQLGNNFGNTFAVAAAPNGNFIYAWSKCLDNPCTFQVFEIEYTILDHSGNTVRGVSKLSDNSGATNTWTPSPSIAVTPNGAIGIAYLQHDTSNTNEQLYFATLDSAGNLTSGPTNITNYVTLGHAYPYSPTIAASDDNHFVIGWQENNVDNSGNSTSNVWYAVCDTAGASVFPPTAITSDNASLSPVLNSLTGGKVILTWWGNVLTGSWGNDTLTYAVINSSGAISRAATTLGSSNNKNYYYIPADAVQMPNGKVAIAWPTNTGVQYDILNSSYMIESGPHSANSPSLVIGNWLSVTTDSSSHVIMTWQDFATAQKLYYALGDSTGAFITPPMVYKNDSGWINVSHNGQGNAPDTKFGDVPISYWSINSIERLYNAGITGGCTTVPLNYCPTTPVTRAQMAVFLLRGMHGSTFAPPAATGTKFTDVPLGSFGAAWIEQLAAEGITSGCGGGNYCPTTPVSRAQMAIFLVRAKHGIAFTPPTATGIFTDVPVGSFGADYIEQLSADAITSGCGGTNYCPNTTVKRDSMAVFLVKTFNLP